ncbi:hypothetical protein [Solirubrobacter pauli]|uniref:hypothetical protein n=1 Tax=Solirubrobacter pauli TaxID=166793 RepID=UPI000EB30EAC|nr:hypothetical protein [Solirubrobacter pauli]
MEDVFAALGLGHGAAIAEHLQASDEPLTWSEIWHGIKDTGASRGTLTKSLARMIEAGLVRRDDETYVLRYRPELALVLRDGASLAAEIQADRARMAAERAQRLRDAAAADVDDPD